jgi:hypothetical protein
VEENLTGGTDSTRKFKILPEIFGMARNFGVKITKMACLLKKFAKMARRARCVLQNFNHLLLNS